MPVAWNMARLLCNSWIWWCWWWWWWQMRAWCPHALPRQLPSRICHGSRCDGRDVPHRHSGPPFFFFVLLFFCQSKCATTNVAAAAASLVCCCRRRRRRRRRRNSSSRRRRLASLGAKEKGCEEVSDRIFRRRGNAQAMFAEGGGYCEARRERKTRRRTSREH